MLTGVSVINGNQNLKEFHLFHYGRVDICLTGVGIPKSFNAEYGPLYLSSDLQLIIIG